MKKMILKIVVAIVVLLLIVGIVRASQLRNIQITKTVEINAGINEVFDNVLYLENFPKWSPFYEADPSQEVKVVGVDGAVGAQYHWLGNKGKDVGFQEIIGIDRPNAIHMSCDISKPFQANPNFDYEFKEAGGKVIVTQDFKLESGFMDAFFMGVFGAKKEMESMNGRGLQLLKELCER